MSAKRPVSERHLNKRGRIQNFKPARHYLTICYLLFYYFLVISRFKILNRRFCLSPEGQISETPLIKKVLKNRGVITGFDLPAGSLVLA